MTGFGHTKEPFRPQTAEAGAGPWPKSKQAWFPGTNSSPQSNINQGVKEKLEGLTRDLAG